MKKTLSALLALILLLSPFALPAAALEEPPSFSSYEEMTAYVRNQLIARNESFRFRYTGDDYRAPALDDLCRHGGDPHGGDYLRLSFRARPEYTDDGDGLHTVSAAFFTDEAQEAAVDAYIAGVAAGCPDGADREKAEYLYQHLCENVTFDLENLYNEQEPLKYTAYGAAVNGRAVCQGFAALFYRLACAAELDCRIVTGKRGGENHAWNIVKDDDIWYHTDAACGAQVLEPAGFFMQGLPGGYAIEYGDGTAAEIEAYPFAPVNEEIVTGVLTDTIIYVHNKTTGRLTVSGVGNMGSNSQQGYRDFWNNTDWNLVTSMELGEGITKFLDFAAVIWKKAKNLRSISIPASFQRIGSLSGSPINGMMQLESITVAEGNPVYHSDGNCLIDTENRELVLGAKNAVIPADGSVTKIGNCAFYRQDVPELRIPDGVTKIGYRAFEGSTIETVRIPDAVETVGNGAFRSCEQLTDVTICAGATALLPSSALADCDKLRSITVEEGNRNYRTDAYGILYRADGTELIKCPAMTPIGAYSLPEGVTRIADNAFEKTSLTEVILPDTVAEIGSSAFSYCEKLESVSLSAGLTTIGSNAFNNCRKLSEIVIPDGVVSIGEAAFGNCFGLKTVTLPPGLTEIASNLFAQCVLLREVAIPDGVERIESLAFYFCREMKRIFIPAGVESIAVRALAGSGGYNLPVCIYGVPGSFAETYAAENQFAFLPACTGANVFHTEEQTAATEGDCTHGAYSEGVRCAECGVWITEPELLEAAPGHDPAVPVRENETLPTCTAEGGFDSVVYCLRCGEVIASAHEKLAALPHADGDGNGYCDECGANICAHEETSLKHKKDASCTENGYSGDRVCDVCGVVLEYGATVFAPGHSPAVSRPAREANCVDPGATEESACSVCGLVLTESRPTPVTDHRDADDDGLCDVCFSPTDCRTYGRCGERLFWYADNGILVFSGGGDSYDFADGAPWRALAEEIDTVYLREGVGTVHGLGVFPALRLLLSPVGASAPGALIPAAAYEFSGGTARIFGTTEYSLYELLNTAYLLCLDHTVEQLGFDALILRAADGREYTEYDILKNGKIINKNHYRIPDGAMLADFRAEPAGYPAFNDLMTAIGENPEKTLILRIRCGDLLPEELRGDAGSYTEQMAILFTEEPDAPAEEPHSGILDFFRTTLAALLALFKKIIKFVKSIFN